MPQLRYESLLLDRTHSQRRWENQPAEGIGPKDINRDEVFRIVRIAQSEGRLVESVGRSTLDVLGRLGLREDGRILRAAVVLFGRTFMPNYPQCELRMARFRGTDKTEFLDQRMIRGPAFKLLEEAQLFCQRHFPHPAKIVPTQMERVEPPLIPPDAMREILVNALIHRDYAIAGGAISLAIFDDRVEVWSAGAFPKGVTPALLTRKHDSVQRNPIIADMFNRAGLIEKWGRGTNRVITMCREAGIAPPEFEEIGESALVTFRVPVKPESQPESQPESLNQRVLGLLRQGPLGKAEISARLGQREVSGQLNKVIRELLRERLVDYTLPDKPNSRLQKYRLTADGEQALGIAKE